MDIIDHVIFNIVDSIICYIGLAIQSMNLMVHKCEDPTKRKTTTYRRNCVRDNEQYYMSTPIHTVSCTQCKCTYDN